MSGNGKGSNDNSSDDRPTNELSQEEYWLYGDGNPLKLEDDPLKKKTMNGTSLEDLIGQRSTAEKFEKLYGVKPTEHETEEEEISRKLGYRGYTLTQRAPGGEDL